MEELLTLNPENATEEEIRGWRIREAARGVVVDEEGRLALLHVSKDGYYKLPGGGIEVGEDRLVALRRECIEEIGCDIEVKAEIGIIVEYRKVFELKQISYCYFAAVKGEIGVPQFTDMETERGFELVWVPYSEAANLLNKSAATALDIEGHDYIAPRDAAILKAAAGHLT